MLYSKDIRLVVDHTDFLYHVFQAGFEILVSGIFVQVIRSICFVFEVDHKCVRQTVLGMLRSSLRDREGMERSYLQTLRAVVLTSRSQLYIGLLTGGMYTLC